MSDQHEMCIAKMLIAVFVLLFGGTKVVVYGEDILKEFPNCLTDICGGSYKKLSNINCKYTERKNGHQNVSCVCKPTAETLVEITYLLRGNFNLTSQNVNCTAVLRVDISSDSSKTNFTVDLDPAVGLPRHMGAPQEFLQWRSWINLTSPIRIFLSNSSAEPLPSLKNFTRLRSFTLSDTHQRILRKLLSSDMRHNYSLQFPDFPDSIEEISLPRDTLFAFPLVGENNFHHLRILDLSDNYLVISSNWVTQSPKPMAPNLERMNLSFNLIQSIESDFFDLFPSLKSLDLSGNRIQDFDSTKMLSKSLTFLNVSHNHGTWNLLMHNLGERLPMLQTLDVSYSSISTHEDISWETKKPFKLQSLYASGYKGIKMANLTIQYLRMKMYYFYFPILINTRIKHLDVSDGNIIFISNLGLTNTTVSYLNISKNYVSDWETDSIFKNKIGLSWVKHVNLSYNIMRLMSPKMLTSLNSLETVDLAGNLFDCNNCSILDFQTWLKNNKNIVLNLNKSHTSPYCRYPRTKVPVLVSESNFPVKSCGFDERLVVGIIIGLCLMLALGFCIYLNRHTIKCRQRMKNLWIRRPQNEPSNLYVNLMEDQ